MNLISLCDHIADSHGIDNASNKRSHIESKLPINF